MKRLTILLCLVLGLTSYGQQDLTLYNMRYLQQSSFTNPSFFPECKVNVGFPGFASAMGTYRNSGFVFSDVFQPNGDSLRLTPDVALDALADRNYLESEFRYDPIHFGFRVNKNYFGMNVSVRNHARIIYPKDFFTLLLKGNGSEELLGETANLDGLSVDESMFTEIGFRYARKFGKMDQLSIGIRPKILLGLFNSHTRTMEASLTTDATTFDLTGQVNMQHHTASVLEVEGGLGNVPFDSVLGELSVGDLFSFQNFGLAIDLGATYNINEKIQVSAAMTDLGYIHWKSNARTYTIDDKSVEFSGLTGFGSFINSSETVGGSAASFFEDFADSLENEFKPVEDTDPYSTMLTARFNVGANYQLAEKHNVGALINSHIVKRKLRAAMTLSYGFRVRKWFGVHANYSVYNRSFNNLGFGMSFNIFPWQFYVMTDNVLGIPFFENSKNAHARMGMNWTFGCKQNDRDKDGIPDKDDDCPKEAGPEATKGCPDRDGDGIIDKEDDCPDEKGPKENQGCPDRDGDGIIDKDDACPDAPGIEAFQGCPDTDEDGIKDSEDECPTEAGIAQFNGCPDTDEDGIRDSEDDCPTTPGIAQFNGCPDTDGDGLKDSEDDCPEKPGEIANKGCPDTDGDGLTDNVDGCPETPGPAANKGCPYGDRDGDGVIDKDDKCPETPGPVDNAGCPFSDLDGDGVLDKDDRCIDAPGPVENAGCPYSDLDGDGVLDKDDRCPQTPGPADNEGCPVIEEEEQEVLNTAFDNLEFETGGAVIKATSYESLKGLAELLTKKPEWKLQIAGHTDDVGSESGNLALSEKRSKSVANYMESQGVGREKLIVKWFGESKPIADNSTPEGRQKNRRVEMEIVFD